MQFALLSGVCILFLAQIVLAQAPPHLTPFSADMQFTSTQASGGAPRDMDGKLYVNPDRMRMDMQGGRGQSIILTNMATQTVDILLPQQQMYMEHKAGEMPGRRAPGMSDVHPYDPQNPCSNDQGMTCKNMGVETVNGRTCDHWQITDKKGRIANVWIDQKLHFPIKSVSEGTTMELTNIKEGENDASLFTIPSGYRKMDLGMMMQGGQGRGMPGGPPQD